jgi:hypothetical protein
MDSLIKKSKLLGADGFGISKLKNKKYYVKYNGKTINFGAKDSHTFLDHKDKNKRKNWYARHTKIYNKNGKQVINEPYSASYWSARLLWPMK